MCHKNPSTAYLPSANSTHSLIASAPPIYLLEISSRILNISGSDPDKDSLHMFSSLLEAIVGPGQDLSYLKRVKDALSILVEAVIATDTAKVATGDRCRTLSSTERPSPPPSSHHVLRDQQTSRHSTVTNNDRRDTPTEMTRPDLALSFPLENSSAFPDWECLNNFTPLTHAGGDDFIAASAYDQMGIDKDYGEDLFGYLTS